MTTRIGVAPQGEGAPLSRAAAFRVLASLPIGYRVSRPMPYAAAATLCMAWWEMGLTDAQVMSA